MILKRRQATYWVDCLARAESECRRVNAALQKAPFADESQRAGIRRHHQKGNHEWLVESFMPGVPMYASAKCAEALGFTGDIGSGSTAGLAQHLFHEIGRVCVVDAILNNMDRLPYFHRNAGNICNWIVSDDSVNGGFVTPQAIDLQANGITNIAGRATYVERVRSIAASTRKVLEQIHQAPAGEDTGAIWQACPVVKPCVTRVRQHFADNLGAMVSNKSVTWLLEGVVAECDTVQNLQSSIEELFATTKSQVLRCEARLRTCRGVGPSHVAGRFLGSRLFKANICIVSSFYIFLCVLCESSNGHKGVNKQSL